MASSSSSGAAPNFAPVAMDACGNKLWLMKVPTFLLEHWAKRDDKPTDVGVVTEKVGPDGKKTKWLQLSEACDYPAEWPREYEMTFDEPSSALYSFSRQSDGKGGGKGPVQFDGVVEKRGDIKPQLTQQYRGMMKNRLAKSEERPELKVLEDEAVPRYSKLTHRDKRDREAERCADARPQPPMCGPSAHTPGPRAGTGSSATPRRRRRRLSR